MPAVGFDTRNYRVLVVDDNHTAAQVLTETIAEMGFPVEACYSGQAALNALTEASRECKSFDLLLLDWQMPVMDGLQTAKRIVALNLPKPPHTIMVTAFSRDEVIDEARACGINEVLRKPVNPSTLMATMVEVVAGGEFPQGDVGESTEENYAIPQEVLALGGARILLVEDNLLNQEVACELLREAGFTVDVADNGMIGLEKLKAMSYDLVFMDMQMPVMDGVSATLEIRRNAAFASLPVVAMTASAMQADRERCIEAGMNDYIVKPIDPDELWAALLRWVKPAAQRKR
jgi:two-component system sensor histidine kinase/response regulator